MQQPISTPLSAIAPRATDAGAAAARYAVLRRLAPALKHDMVVHLQSVAMMAEVMSARMDKGEADTVELQNSVSRMNRLARQAVLACLKVTEWIDPAADESVRLSDGVQESYALLQSSLNFRGFSVHNAVAPSDFEVSRVALRNLLPAALLGLADAAHSTCKLTLEAQMAPDSVRLSIYCAEHIPAAIQNGADLPQPRLHWADVQALADLESVGLEVSEHRISMRFPRMVPTTALQIAPV
ncbi:MAG: hypothetical protein EOO25_00610 [Comamonadaceae bacterium]|nr:MAG: hypothetical protein EOO25_00610 [Comamonadaceae bacterium]